MTEEEFSIINMRRHQLITKEFSSGLTIEEVVELEKLGLQVDDYVDILYPLPTEATNELLRRAVELAEKFKIDCEIDSAILHIPMTI